MSQSESDLTVLLSAAGVMTAQRLQNIALKLGNGGWCRHWYNYGGHKDPWIMAIQVRNWDGAPVGVSGMEKEGFVMGEGCLYFIKRCNEDGTPFIGG